ncbi:MAG TPA: efflux RND transporter permease subunit [bacterium]|nr:efflux RND transporter permease subunit [bacterium]
MNLTKFFLEKPIFTIVIMLLLVWFGAGSLLKLRVETLPEVNAPVIYAAIPLVGGAPEEVESLVTIPVEQKIAEIEDVSRISSSSWHNVSLVVVYFNETVDPETKFKEFRDKISEAKALLPAEALDPIVQEISFENLPMMFLGFSGDNKSQHELSMYASTIKKELEAIPGVKRIVMTGATEKRIEIGMRPDSLQKYGTDPLKYLIENLEKINTNFPGGKLTVMNKEYTVRTLGKFDKMADLKRMAVGTHEGEPIRLSMMADIEETYPQSETIAHVDGHRGVTLAIMKKRGHGTINVADRIKEKLKDYDNVVVMSDASEFVRHQIGELRNHAAWGVCLVLAVLFISLGFRVAAIVSFAIPMSFLMTFTAMYFKGMTIDMVSLFSLLLALGMMVDNSIVVCENIYRHMTLGKSADRAALEATNEVGWPIFSSTAAVVAAFLPIGIFLKGPIGEFTRPISIVVTFALLASLIVANFFNPVLCSIFMKKIKKEEERKSGRIGLRARAGYGRIVEWCLDHGMIVMSAAGLILVSSVLLVVLKIVGLQLFPQLDTAKFYIDLKTPPGSTMEDTRESVARIEKFFDESKYVKHYVSNVGSSGTRIEIDDHVYFGSNIARFIVDLKPMKETGKSHKKILEEFRYRISTMFEDGTEAVFIEKVLGPPVGPPINIQVSGNDFTRLRKTTEVIEEMLKNQRGVVDLKNDAPGNIPQIVLKTRQDELAGAGMTTRDIGGFIFLALTGHKIGDIMVGDEKTDIFLKIKKDPNQDVTALQSQSFTLPSGEEKYFSDLLSFQLTDGLSSIEREQGRRTITIEANVAAGFEAKRIVDALKLRMPGLREQMIADDPEMKNVNIEFAGETMLLGEAMKNLSVAFLVSMIFIYLILLIEFKSTTQPLIILVCVPYALVGVILTLLILGYSFSILAGIGLLCLVGIVVNNGIIYIDYANLLRERGMKRREACVEACLTRMRPIILTKITVILGILPLAAASAAKTQFWKPLCWSIIGGLFIATTLTLVIIPVAYYIVEGWRKGYYDKRGGGDSEVADASSNALLP